jgi:1-acyl-sn-glycerol-3-phosphate acyltransferase
MNDELKNIEDHDFYIDLDKIIQNQKSKLIKRLPRFVISHMKRIIRQEEVNRQLNLLKDKYDIDFIQTHADYLNIRIKTVGIENLPDNGRFIFACNHPLGAVDFYAALIATRKKYPVVKALANDLLLSFKNLRTLFLPVNAFGKTPTKYHQLIEEAYASSIQIMTFPAGEVSRKTKGEIKDGPWHRSFIRNAIEYQRNVIPIYIHARNSPRFYRWYTIRKRLGIKINFELFLLPDELFRQKDKTIGLVIGKPINYETFMDSKSHLEWAKYVREEVYKLKELANLS